MKKILDVKYFAGEMYPKATAQDVETIELRNGECKITNLNLKISGEYIPYKENSHIVIVNDEELSMLEGKLK